jgi:hypothetical protein
MKLISFDVGIKNLAYCIIDISSSILVTPIQHSKYHILDWGVLNLNQSNKSTVQNAKCQHSTTKGKCTKNARFVLNQEHYCGVHLKKQVFIPKEEQLSSLSKASKVDLIQHIQTVSNIVGITDNNTEVKRNKKELVDLLHKYYVKPYKPVNAKPCSEASLVHIGVELRNALREVMKTLLISSDDIILIENQISPIASKMKSIQGMLTQFFIDHENTNVVYMSSSLKLKLNFTDSIIEKETNKDEENNSENTNANTYSSRKQSGIDKVEDLFSKNLLFHLYSSEKNYQKWKDVFYQHKKKDDLADCLLQGIYWISRKMD